jgi:hypothetical protein
VNAGEQYTWELLKELDSQDVQTRTGATYDPGNGTYQLDLFNQRIGVQLEDGAISGSTPEAELLVGRLSYFSRISILSFLVNGQNIPPSGQWVKPEEMPGMDAMVRGSHALPLSKVATRYANDTEAFLQRGSSYGGTPMSFGDASLLLHPFRAMPLVVILWTEDDEFPARCGVLLDRSSQSHVPQDVLWCIMMLTLLALC